MEGPCYVLFILTNTIVVATFVITIKIKHGGSHTASNGFNFPLSPVLSVSVAGWENLSHLTQLVPAPLGMELKSQGEGGVAWTIRVGRHTHLPFQLLAQGLQRTRGSSSDLNLRAEMLKLAQGAFSVVSILKSLNLPTYKPISCCLSRSLIALVLAESKRQEMADLRGQQPGSPVSVGPPSIGASLLCVLSHKGLGPLSHLAVLRAQLWGHRLLIIWAPPLRCGAASAPHLPLRGSVALDPITLSVSCMTPRTPVLRLHESGRPEP